MKAGAVTTFRVNPRDCQSILDVLDAAGVRRESLSFAQCASLALGALLETARHTKLIPEPDEFQYLNRLSPYLGPQKQKKKTKVSKALHDLGGSMRAPVLTEAPRQAGSARWDTRADPEAAGEPLAPAAPAVSPEVLRLAQESLTRLLVKKEQFEDTPNWTPEDEDEYRTVYKIVYPHG